MKKPHPIARVVLFQAIDRPLDYLIPESLRGRVKPGARVLVPVRQLEATGLVIGLAEKAEVAHVHPIRKLLDETPLLDGNLLELARWLRDRYLTDWGTVIRTLLPPGLDASPRVLYRLTEEGRKTDRSPSQGSKGQRAVLRAMARSASGRRKGLTAKIISRRSGLSSIHETLRGLVQKGWVERIAFFAAAQSSGEPAFVQPNGGSAQTVLPFGSSLKDTVVQPTTAALSGGRSELFCITGLNHDECLSAISEGVHSALKQDRQTLILVPELAQVRPLAEGLAARLGKPVGLMHAKLSDRSRRAAWFLAKEGGLPIVVGTRSAVFAPMKALGLIVVVSESDPSHKAEESPPYHVRDVAMARGKIEKASVLLTAPAPSVETYVRFQQSECRILGEGLMPALKRTTVSLVDLKTEKFGEILSGPLKDAIERQVSARRTVLLLLNRKGFSTALLCRDCGHLFRCARCSVALVFHRRTQQLLCHYCGIRQKLPMGCPVCKGIHLGGIGIGLEQAEVALRGAFPGVRVQRVERGHSPSSGPRTAEIWLATNWIFRLSERPRFGLVALMDADSDFYLPDFLAAERAFQSIVQALAEVQRGSSGAGKELILQTRYPEHPSIAWVKEGDPDIFYNAEISDRKTLGYPPYMRLAAITLRSASPMPAETAARKWGDRLREAAGDQAGIQILGPIPAPLAQLRGRHRFLILVKAATHDLLTQVIRAAYTPYRRGTASRVQMTIDVDPLSIR